MTVDRSDFPKFFAAVNGGHNPFLWQERLLDALLADGRWPDRIAAPTGAGKTSAIDVHVFATALTATNGGPRLPRRLAMVVDRRVLVDDQYQRATALAETLKDRKEQHPLIAEVAKLLAGLHTAEGDAAKDAPPLVTARLRGGYVPSRSWADYPTACAVLCATPDMWGSRLLFGGYGTSRLAAPREAGLLAFDSAVMVDEAHLARQLLVTARRVSDLARVAERPLAGVPALQVVEVTATPAGDPASGQLAAVSVSEDDLAEDLLAKRLTRPKPVTLLRVPGWPTVRQPGKAAAEIARSVAAMHAGASLTEDGATEDGAAEDGGKTVGCFVNTVPMAMSVADALRKQDLRVVTVCGQVRPADMTRLAGEYPGLLTTHGHDDVDVLVTTQSLEVGADLDLAGIVTELATGSALAQRAGRVNRLGKRASGPVTIVVPDGDVTDTMRSGPYSGAELGQALTWVRGLSQDPAGFAPWAIRQSPPPGAHPQRMLYQRPELGDAWHWARTGDDLAAPPELELWLADSLEEETSVALVVRDALPADPAEALEFVRDLPPAPWEAFPVPYRTAQRVLAELLELGQVPVRLRGDEVTTLRLRSNSSVDVRPGDVIVADSSAEIFTRAADQGFSPQVVAARASADDTDGLDTARRGRANDVLHLHPDPRPGSVVLRIEWAPDSERIAGLPRQTAHRIVAAFADGFDDDTERSRRDSLARLLESVPSGELPASLLPVTSAAVRLLRHGKVKDSDIIVRTVGEEGIRVIVIDNRRAVAEEDVRQVFTPRDRDDCPVLLHAHQRDVGARAERIGSVLRLPGSLNNALVTAGEHHDDGKADLRFQVHRLGAGGIGQPWAKSLPGKTVRQVRKQEGEAGLPTGWRHEQRSVVDGWPAAHAVPDADPELILRLIGTSHGRGRASFPHVCAELAGAEDTADWHSLAADLFDAGAWDELIESTHVRYGVWGCAFLEAVFRAADCQVSREGR